MATELDAAIPLSGRPMAPPPDQLKTLGEVMNIKRQGQELQAGDLENQARVRSAAAEAATAKSMSLHPNDPDAVGTDLANGGFGNEALKWNTALATHRKTLADTHRAELENQDATLRVRANMLAGITDQATLDATKQHLIQGGNQAAADELGDTYDPKNPQDVARIHTLMASGMSAAEQIRERAKSAEEIGQAHSRDLSDQKEQAELNRLHESGAGRILSLTKNQQEWDSALAGLRAQMKPEQRTILDKFGSTWSPENVKKAADLTMTPKERDEMGFKNTSAEQQWQRLQDQEQRIRDLESNQRTKNPELDPRLQSAYKTFLSQYNKAHVNMGGREIDPATKKMVPYAPAPDIKTWGTQQGYLQPGEAGANAPPAGPAAPVTPPAGAQAPPAAPAVAAPAPIAAAPKVFKTKSGQEVQPGAKVKLKDGRTVTVKSIDDQGRITF